MAKRELTDVEKAERLLADALNEANRRGLKLEIGSYTNNWENPTRCCVLGALALAEGTEGYPVSAMASDIPFIGMASGNDFDGCHDDELTSPKCLGYAIGRSFRDALR